MDVGVGTHLRIRRKAVQRVGWAPPVAGRHLAHPGMRVGRESFQGRCGARDVGYDLSTHVGIRGLGQPLQHAGRRARIGCNGAALVGGAAWGVPPETAV